MNEEYFIFTKDKIQTFDPDMVFRVFYLEAPLSILGKKFGLNNLDSNLIELNAFHTGIGFQSTDASKPYEFYLDFLSRSIGLDTFLPKIITNPDGTETLEWRNQGFVTIGIDINRDYWSGNVYIGNLNGAQLVQYQQWVLNTFIPNNLFYEYSRTIQGLSRASIYNPILRSSICDTFCFESYIYMSNMLQMCIDYVTDPFETIVAFVVDNPTQVTQLDFNDPVQRKFIIDYYKQLYQYIDQKFQFMPIFNQTVQEINQTADIPTKKKLIRQLNTDWVTGSYVVMQTIQSSFSFAIIYTYAPDNSMQYYKIDFTSIFINYIESNLKRTITAINIYGQPVLDAYTIPSTNVCQTREGISSCNGRNWVVLLLGILLVFNIVFVVLFILYIMLR